jgi:hypothetical protein
MSGHEDSDSGQSKHWTEEDFAKLLNDPSDDSEMFDYTYESGVADVQSHNNTLHSVPIQENQTLGGMSRSGSGYVNHSAISSQFADLPMFASPPAQTFGVEPMSNTPLVSADRTTALPAQAFYGPTVSNLDPFNQGVSPYHVMGLNKGPTWNPTGADLPQQYLPTMIQSGYPVPRQQQQWSGMEHTQFQQAGQALAGADTVVTHSHFQPNTAGNQFFAPQPQSGSPIASHGFSHPAAAPARRTLAPKPASDSRATAAIIQYSNDDAKPMPPLAAPENKETKVKQTVRRNRPTTSKAKKPTTRMPLYNSQLPVLSLEDAKKAVAIKRFELEVVDDDWKDVTAQKADFVGEIVKALEVGYRPQAEEHDRLTAEGRAEFTRWQKEHENKSWTVLDDEEVKDAAEFAQACAVIFFHMTLEAHQSKFLADPGKTVSNGSVDVTMKCSARLNAAIAAIGEYPIVKYDFLRQERLVALIASPRGFYSRKVENMGVNYKKKKGVGPVRIEIDTKDSAIASKVKSQGKRKRKEPSPPPSDEEDEEDDDEAGNQSDDEFVQPVKRTKRR